MRPRWCLRWRRLVLVRERPGVISKAACWLLVDLDGWLYIHDTWRQLVWQVATEWRDDKHIVG